MMLGYWYGGGLGWENMIINTIITVGFIVGFVFLVIWLVKRFGNSSLVGSFSKSSPTAVDIAKERYAKGEITRNEFQNLLVDLESR